ncbi:MAG: hypothetical protein WB772_19175 [Xanthobacteraceae bacterium]
MELPRLRNVARLITNSTTAINGVPSSAGHHEPFGQILSYWV